MPYKQYAVSEIFYSIQGEGRFVGVPTGWVRFFSCNFRCLGFSQNHLPRDQWKDPGNEIDISNITDITQLPVLDIGCDSYYSHYPRFRKLVPHYTAQEICDKVSDCLTSSSNPAGKFLHPKSNQYVHLALTGGEPMMSQSGIGEVLNEFWLRGNFPKYITVESNGTQMPRQIFKDMLDARFNSRSDEWFWSISPKLSASGEAWEQAIQPEVLYEYAQLSDNGQLKYVVDGSNQCWQEVEEATELYRKNKITWPVFIMPVGSTEQQQENIAAKICEQCLSRGYNFSTRLQSYIFGNAIGT